MESRVQNPLCKLAIWTLFSAGILALIVATYYWTKLSEMPILIGQPWLRFAVSLRIMQALDLSILLFSGSGISLVYLSKRLNVMLSWTNIALGAFLLCIGSFTTLSLMDILNIYPSLNLGLVTVSFPNGEEVVLMSNQILLRVAYIQYGIAASILLLSSFLALWMYRSQSSAKMRGLLDSTTVHAGVVVLFEIGLNLNDPAWWGKYAILAAQSGSLSFLTNANVFYFGAAALAGSTALRMVWRRIK